MSNVSAVVLLTLLSACATHSVNIQIIVRNEDLDSTKSFRDVEPSKALSYVHYQMRTMPGPLAWIFVVAEQQL